MRRAIGWTSICLALSTSLVSTSRAQTVDLEYQLAYQRGIEAVTWSMPAVSIRDFRAAAFKDYKNWLPAPKGGFRFAFRFDGPKDKLIDWTYDMTGLVRV